MLFRSWIDVGAGHYLETPGSARTVGAPTTLEPGQTWSIDLPKNAPFAYRLVVSSGTPSPESDLAWLSRQTDRERALGELRKKGLTVLTVSHRAEP